MTPELWQRLKPLYNAALDLPQAERNDFVQQMCGSDPECAAELHDLLAAEEGSDYAFASPLGSMPLLLSLRPVILPADTVLGGRFRIVRHIGSGGMGDVYEALDEQMEGSRIALKTIRPSIAANAAALARFKDEVRLARRVSGPNVCRIHELYLTNPAEQAHGVAFLTMELLEGVTLHDRIGGASALSLEYIEGIFEQLCKGICCIHEAGVVHQDLKPRNVMLVPQSDGERVVVTDFGLARTAVPATGQSHTGVGEPFLVAGTPSYMAPEQFEGREVGPATDVYALGLILYEMATGLQPFAAHTPLAAAIRRSKAPTHASDVRAGLPRVWDDVITRCLEYDPEQRFRTAEEVVSSLKHHGKVIFRLGQGRRLVIPRTALFAAAITLLLCLGAGLWLVLGRPRHPVLAPDAARYYSLGMTALREGSYMKATRLLAMVTKRDPTYALAHAALADAWTELDFTGAAQREMLLAAAPEGQRGLNEMERRYIDAVRTTLTRDYSAAAQDYEAILKKLPDENKAQGYVDLGRIYEKAGRVGETVDSYETAAKLNPDDPAPFLHLGILKSRLRDPDGATKAFDQAESLYNAESNLEGLAEVAYQRGYGANVAADSAAATHFLEQSLAIARQIPSVQLEVRSLSQLSSVAYNDSKDDKAILLANQVISTARANGLEYWMTDGLMRLGNTYLDKGDFADANTYLEEALRRSQESDHPRLEAATMLTLASLRDQEQHWDQAIPLARSALKYFQDYGFLASADQALTLIARGERSKGEFEAALKAGNTLLANADQSHSEASVLLAEELVGSILLRQERYPEALDHYRRATELADTLKQNDAYPRTLSALLLSRLGRRAEAEAQLAEIPAELKERFDIGSGMAAVVAEMQLNFREEQAAWNTVQAAWAKFPTLRTSTQVSGSSLLRTAVLAQTQLGPSEKGRQLAAQLAASSNDEAEAWQGAQSDLVQAQFELRSNHFASAKSHAETAEAFFAEKGMLESDALSLLAEAEAAQGLGDQTGTGVYSKKSVDIFHQIAQSWGVPVFRLYLTRPDRQQTIRTLGKLRAASGDTLDELPQ